jgi:hypothetical protein
VLLKYQVGTSSKDVDLTIVSFLSLNLHHVYLLSIVGAVAAKLGEEEVARL